MLSSSGIVIIFRFMVECLIIPYHRRHPLSMHSNFMQASCTSCISPRRAALHSISFRLSHPCSSHLFHHCHVFTHSWGIFLNSLSPSKVENIMWMSCTFIDINILKGFLKQCSDFEFRTAIFAHGPTAPTNDDCSHKQQFSYEEWLSCY